MKRPVSGTAWAAADESRGRCDHKSCRDSQVRNGSELSSLLNCRDGMEIRLENLPRNGQAGGAETMKWVVGTPSLFCIVIGQFDVKNVIAIAFDIKLQA